MKERGYKVHITADTISVEHRASFRPRTLIIFAVTYAGYCLLPAVRRVIVDFCRSGDLVIGGFAIFMLLIPLFSGFTFLFFKSGEVMRCDRQELHYATRRTWGRWRRFRIQSDRIRGLTREGRGGGRARYYTVLTFTAAGERHDMLEDLSATDSDSVLHACKAFGVDAVITVNTAAKMLKDIEERGWLVNPLRSDEH